MISGGDVLEIFISHPEQGGITLEHKSTEDATFKKGGFQNADDDANITSSGNFIYIKNRKGWMFETTIAAAEGVHDYLQKIHESSVEATINVTFQNGKVRAGKGLPVGDIDQNDQAATIPLKIMGSGTFSEI